MLRGVLLGKTIRAIASELSYGREWLHRTWWPQSVNATTSVLMRRYLRQPAETTTDALAITA